MQFPFEELCGHLKKNAAQVNTARLTRKETALTAIVGQFYASLPGAKAIYIASSSHGAISGKDIDLRKQWTDRFGEHDVSVQFEGVAPKYVTEVKYARIAGADSGEQNQVVQTYCYFIYDLLFSAISGLHSKPQGTSTGALAFVEDAVISKSRPDMSNPWKSLAGNVCRDAKDSLHISPSTAKINSGRGNNKTWPDFRAPTTIEQRHISLSMTGGTSTKLLGLFTRDPYSLHIDFSKSYECLTLNEEKLHVLFLQPTNLELRGVGTPVTDKEAILRWLP